VSGVTLLLNSETRNSIAKSIEQIGLTMENLEKISRNLSLVVDEQKHNLSASVVNVKEMTDQFNKDSKALGNIIHKFSTISDSINPSEIKSALHHIDKASASLETILSEIKESKGTIGLLMKDSTLYNQLAESSDNLNQLLVDLRRNPHRYLKVSAFDFGKEVYLAPGASYRVNEKIDFKVFLFSSTVKIPHESSIFQGITDVTEEQSGSNFLYFAGKEKSYDKVRIILNKVQLSFPQASLKAYEDNEEISVKKALKICSE
jgi:phospholipid/cholesterol/gamma-HCH transport system substrate-binding protein